MTAKKPLRWPSGVRIKRRDFFKLAQLAGLGAVGGSLALFGPDATAAETGIGICRICTMHCGIVTTSRGTRLLRVEGHVESSTRGFICHHATALREIVHSYHRVRSPLRRAGNSFEEISWERALGEIAERMNAIKAEHGARAVAVQTGWPFVRHPLVGILHRFCRAFGTPNLATVASLCEAAGRMGKELTFGTKYAADVPRLKTLLLWGANPTFSYPTVTHEVASMALRDRNLVVIDPVRTELAAGATLHLQVRPGTDGALALGIMNVILSEGLFDAAYVTEHTVGFDRLERLVQGYSPARVEELTTVPAEQIITAARLFALQGPASIWEGLGVEHHRNGVQTVRALSALEAVCGYVGGPDGAKLMAVPGETFWSEPLPALYRMATPEPVPPPVADKPIGYDAYPLFEVYNRQAQANLFTAAIIDDRPYPLRGLILVGSNAFVTSPGSTRRRAAAEKLDLLVSVDPFLSASGQLSHYVLPASTFVEVPDFAAGAEPGATEGLVPAQHDSWPDWRIVFGLAGALGLGEYFPWGSLGEALRAPHVPYMKDPAHTLLPNTPPGTGPRPPPRFPTSSGKIELHSETMERFGYDPLPQWVAPARHPGADVGGEFPLILVSGPRTRAYINSQFRDIPSIAFMLPEPFVELHAETAVTYGITDGQQVAVVSPHGRITLRARVTDRVHRDAAVVPAGWATANANELTESISLDPISGFPVFRSAVCRLEPV